MLYGAEENLKGLTTQEVLESRRKFGRNELAAAEKDGKAALAELDTQYEADAADQRRVEPAGPWVLPARAVGDGVEHRTKFEGQVDGGLLVRVAE